AREGVADGVPFGVDDAPAHPAWKTGRLSASRYRRDPWAAAAVAYRPALLAPQALEQRRERPRVEDDRDRGDRAVAHRVPLGDARVGRRLGVHVVDRAHLVALDEDLALVNAGDDPAEPLHRLQVGVGVAVGRALHS